MFYLDKEKVTDQTFILGDEVTHTHIDVYKLNEIFIIC